MRFGAHCVLYGAEVGSDPQKIIGTLAKTGAEGCELGQRFFGLERREELETVLRENQMELAGLHCNQFKLTDLLENPQAAKEALEAVAEFVAPLKNKNVIATGMVPMEEIRDLPIAAGAPMPQLHDKETVKQMALVLNDIVKDIMKTYGVQVHYHNHSWEFADNGLIWFALADYAPDLKFALDTGWVAVSGYQPLKLIKTYPGRFDYIHLRDYKEAADPVKDTFNQVHKGFIDLGTGKMGYPEFIRELKNELKDDAWAIVEYEIGNFDQNSYLGAINYLRGLQDMADLYRKGEQTGGEA